MVVEDTVLNVARGLEDMTLPTVRVQMTRKDARLFRLLQDHRARTVAKQHAGAAVAPVEQAREDLGSHHECALALAVGHELVGDRNGVKKSSARGLNVEGCAAGHAEFPLQQARRRGKDDVGRAGGQHDQVDVVSGHARSFHGTTRGMQGQV